MNIVGAALRGLGVYAPLKRTVQYLTDPRLRQRNREVSEDLERTRHEIGNWAAAGAEHEDPNKVFAILSFTNLPLHAKFQGLVAKTMQLRGYKPVIFTYSGCRFGHEYFRLFGLKNLIMWDQYSAEAGATLEDARRLGESLLPSKPTVNEIIDCRFQGVDVGKHALSVTCRRLIQGSLDLEHPDTLELFKSELARAVQSVIVSTRFFEEYPVKKMLVRDAGYIPNGGIFETALERGIDCVVYEQGQRRGTWIQKRYSKSSKGEHYFSISQPVWQELLKQDWTKEEDEKLENEFAGRYRPDSTDDTRRLQSGKRLKSPEEVRTQLGLDPSKKTAIIFSHIAWDAAFFFGKGLFEDFEQWLFETVKFVAAECPQINWIVKLHPFNVFKLQREGKTEESEMRLLRSLMPLPEHVKILHADCDINTQSLFPIVDYALTVNGTVGMEFPCYGVPALLAGTGRYDGRGFTMEPRTREEYFEALRNLHKMPRLSSEAQILARKHFLTLTTRRQVSFDDIAPMELKRINEADSDLHDNVSIRAHSMDEFRSAASIKNLSRWLVDSNSPDFMET